MRAERTRAAAAYGYALISIVVAVLLIDFVAQNGHRVAIHFFGFAGHTSEVVALLIAAVAGAAIVAIPSLIRILQLRKAVRLAGRTSA